MSKRQNNFVQKNPEFLAVEQHQYSGPIPPAGEMQRYDEILPGAADRILSMAEREQAQRHAEIVADRKFRNRGQIIGACLVFFLIAVAVLFAYIGKDLLSGTLLSVVVLGIASIFVLGNKWKEDK